jgi:hypothetical protein
MREITRREHGLAHIGSESIDEKEETARLDR